MTLSDPEVRHLTIELLTAPTARDEQELIGASNLSNGCAFCLASNFMGDDRETPAGKRAWGGRVNGTAVHGLLERRIKQGQAEFAAGKKTALANIAARHPGAMVEVHQKLGHIDGYGDVGTTPDLVLVDEQHLIDWKGTDDKKSCLTQDFLGVTDFGRLAKHVAVFGQKEDGTFRKVIEGLSEKVYAEEMAGAEYKVQGYYSQTQLYGKCLNDAGIKVTRMSLVMISRTNTMWFDNPSEAGYDDPTKSHGIWVLSFDYDPAYAQGVWDRGVSIWEALQAGAPMEAFARHPLCFPCSIDAPAGSPEAIAPLVTSGAFVDA